MRNRYLIALAAVGIHISIGSVYAFSVLAKPIMAETGWGLTDVTWAFSLAILFLGTSAGLLGGLVERLGPRRSGLLSTLFFCTGLLGTAWAMAVHSLPMLYLFYGVVGGIGLGVGYITPVSTLVKYFPGHRGFATGLAIMGFGFAALIAGPVMQWLTATRGLFANFAALAAVYAVVMTASSLYLRRPTPEQEAALQAAELGVDEPYHHRPLDEPAGGPVPADKGATCAEACRSPFFAMLWWIFFVNITCGIGLLAVISPMAQEVIGLSAAHAAGLVGLVGLVNGAGRLAWATVSDVIGRPMTYIAFFALEVAAFAVLAYTTTATAFQALTLVIISCYGGGFSCMPAYLADIFGTRELSAIHGRVLTAWGAAGVAGPVLIAYLRESMNSYAAPLLIFAGLFVVNLAIAAVLRHRLAGAPVPNRG